MLIHELQIPVSTEPPRFSSDADMASLYDRLTWLLGTRSMSSPANSVYSSISKLMLDPEGWIFITNADLYAPAALVRKIEQNYQPPSLHEQVWIDEFARLLGAELFDQGEIVDPIVGQRDLKQWTQRMRSIEEYGKGVGDRYHRSENMPASYFWILKIPLERVLEETVHRRDHHQYYAMRDRVRNSIRMFWKMHDEEPSKPKTGKKSRLSEMNELRRKAVFNMEGLAHVTRRLLDQKRSRHIAALLASKEPSGLALPRRDRYLAAAVGAAIGMAVSFAAGQR